MFWLSKPFRYVEARPGLLGVGGIVDLPSFGLTYDDLAAIPAEFQVRNVGAYASQAKLGTMPIRGVRLAALLAHVGAHPEAILVNVRSRSDSSGRCGAARSSRSRSWLTRATDSRSRPSWVGLSACSSLDCATKRATCGTSR